MKKLLIALTIVVLAGFGCTKAPAAETGGPSADGSWPYMNADYGFQMTLPPGVEMRQREEENRPMKYLGLDADFFASLRDVERESKATNLAFFYAMPTMSTEDFAKALEASDATGDVKVTSTEDVTINGIAMKKVTSTTEMGEDKVHYLFEAKDKTIVVSRFLNEEVAFEPIFATIAMR
jgi:hypothetical protein